MTMSAPTKIRMFWTNITRPCEMSSCSASMSEVMRDDEPAGLLALEEVDRQAHAGGGTPARAVAQERLADPATSQDRRAGRARARAPRRRGRASAARFERAGVAARSSPASMPYRTSAGPASRHAVCSDEHERRERDLPAVRPQHPPQPAHDLVRLLAGRASSPRRPAPPLDPSAPHDRAAAVDRGRARADIGARRAPRGSAPSVASSSSCVPSATTTPAVEQHDAVGERDRRGPVGDDDRRPPGHHLAERGADLVLLRRVDRRRRVVEDQHPRVGEHRARDRDALTLPARQREAVLADHGVVAVGQRVDERRRRRRAGAARRTCVQRRLRIGERDVLAHRVGEEERVLEHDADRRRRSRTPQSRTSTPSSSTRPPSTS